MFLKSIIHMDFRTERKFRKKSICAILSIPGYFEHFLITQSQTLAVLGTFTEDLQQDFRSKYLDKISFYFQLSSLCQSVYCIVPQFQIQALKIIFSDSILFGDYKPVRKIGVQQNQKMKVQNQLISANNKFNPQQNKDHISKHDNFVKLNSSSGDQLPRNPINIVFKDISYSVQIQKKSQAFQLPWNKQKEQKDILKNVTGIFKAGEVSAILGASGAGKTTLLNIIACRVSHKSAGKLYANKTEYNYDTFGDFANYVMQNDILMQTLTVRETLLFAADLKLNISKKQKERKIQDLAKSMKLQNCLDTKVGGQLVKGISGGQKKRTSIAFELISDPQVIILDQPTSGLDSFTSFIIVDYLRKLAQEKGKTVIMTIHQPSSDIYQRFDRLFLMVEGRLVYQGPANLAIQYFDQNFGLKCSQFQNPAQFQIQVIHQQSPANVKRYPEYFKKYDQKQALSVLVETQKAQNLQYTKRENNVSLCDSFTTLMKRDALSMIRNPMLLQSRLIQQAVLGLFVGGVYFGAGQKDYTVQNYWFAIIGFYFFFSIGALMETLSPISLVFPQERPIFLKEENSRLYSVLPYFLSRSVIEIPYIVLVPFIANTILYFMMGLSQTAEQYFIFYLITFLVNLSGSSLGLLLGSIVQDAKSVSAVVPIVLIPFVLFSGLFKNTGNIPAWLGWIQYISPLKYGYLAMIENEIKYKASNVASMNFDVSMWGAIGLLIALATGYRLLSLFFLWYLRTRIE